MDAVRETKPARMKLGEQSWSDQEILDAFEMYTGFQEMVPMQLTKWKLTMSLGLPLNNNNRNHNWLSISYTTHNGNKSTILNCLKDNPVNVRDVAAGLVCHSCRSFAIWFGVVLFSDDNLSDVLGNGSALRRLRCSTREHTCEQRVDASCRRSSLLIGGTLIEQSQIIASLILVSVNGFVSVK